VLDDCRKEDVLSEGRPWGDLTWKENTGRISQLKNLQRQKVCRKFFQGKRVVKKKGYVTCLRGGRVGREDRRKGDNRKKGAWQGMTGVFIDRVRLRTVAKSLGIPNKKSGERGSEECCSHITKKQIVGMQNDRASGGARKRSFFSKFLDAHPQGGGGVGITAFNTEDTCRLRCGKKGVHLARLLERGHPKEVLLSKTGNKNKPSKKRESIWNLV